MADQYVRLVGAEEIARAAHNISSAATDMQRAASNFDSTVFQLRQFMDEWLLRFENVLNEHNKQKEG